MAKLKPGPLGALIGRIGNISYYDSPLGIIARIRKKPMTTYTKSSSVTHQYFKFVLTLYSRLTPPQALAWKELAYTITYTDKLGNLIHKRGRDLFQSVNRNRVEMGKPIIFDPPRKIYPKPVLSMDVEVHGDKTLNDIKLFFKPAIDKNTNIYVFATRSLSLGIFSVKPCWYRKIAVIDSSFKSGDSILDKYNSVFEEYYVRSHRIAFRLKVVSSISGFKGAEIETLESAIS